MDLPIQYEQRLRALEQSTRAFRDAPAAQTRTWVLLAFYGGAGAVTFLLALFGFYRIPMALVGLMVLTTLEYLVLRGVTQHSYLYRKCREYACSLSWLALGKLTLAVLLFVVILWLFGQLGLWLYAAVVGLGLALGLHYTVDRQLARERAVALQPIEHHFQNLRAAGQSEAMLWEFTCKNAGYHWEEYFEALFGYEAKLEARGLYADGAQGGRPRFASWRDLLVRAIDRAQRQPVEEPPQPAPEPVPQAAVQQAPVEAPKEPVVEAPPPPPKPPPPQRVELVNVLEVVDRTVPKRASRPRYTVGDIIGVFIGGTTRFVLGALLLSGCLWWMHKNGLLPSSTDYDALGTYTSIWERLSDAKPLDVPLPARVLDLFTTINPGVAGLVLILSSLWWSRMAGMLALVGAAIMVLGPGSTLIPPVGSLPAWQGCLAIGAAVALFGLIFFRDR